MITYVGVRKWTAKTSYKETLNSYETFGEYAVDFKYILIDVNRYTKEELLKLENLIASVFLLEQKVEKERENIEKIIDENKEVDIMISNLEKTILQEMKEREKKGIKKGIKNGIEKGIEETVIKLLKKKSGDVPEEYVKKIDGANRETLMAIVDNIFEINKIEDLERFVK